MQKDTVPMEELSMSKLLHCSHIGLLRTLRGGGGGGGGGELPITCVPNFWL